MLAQISGIKNVAYINLDLDNDTEMNVHLKSGVVIAVAQRQSEDYGLVFSANDKDGVGIESVDFADIVTYITNME